MNQRERWSRFKTIGERRGLYKRRSPLWTWPVLFVLIVFTVALFSIGDFSLLSMLYSEENKIAFYGALIIVAIGALVGAYFAAVLLREAYKSERDRFRKDKKGKDRTR